MVQFKGYRMVFTSICEHASSAFIFASTSSAQFSHASTFEITIGEQRAHRKFSVVFAPSNLANTFKTGQETQS